VLLEKVADRALRQRMDGLFELSGDPMLVDADDSVDARATLAVLKQIKRPVLFVRGEGSAILSRAAARELLAEVPQSRMSVVSRAGHAVMLDNPEGFCAAVEPFVLRVLSPPVATMREG
jgi:pimeloyl-ACP methyl ester carboxylesterase